MDRKGQPEREDVRSSEMGYYLQTEPMESGMGGAGDISGGMGGSAGGDIGEMAEAGLLEGVDPQGAIGLPHTPSGTQASSGRGNRPEGRDKRTA